MALVSEPGCSSPSMYPLCVAPPGCMGVPLWAARSRQKEHWRHRQVSRSVGGERDEPFPFLIIQAASNNNQPVLRSLSFMPTLFLAHKLKMFTGPHREDGEPRVLFSCTRLGRGCHS